MNAVDKNFAGVYIHIPFCKHKCDYCSFVSTADHSLMHRYTDALIKQIRLAPSDLNVDSVYIGGGTPSCLYRGGVTDILNAVRASFKVCDNSEITIECNPESCDSAFIEECSAAGINRISMGLQSANDSTLRNIGRIHSFSDYIRAVELVRGYFENVSTDIILGLPGETERDIIRSLEAATEYCDHVSVYALSVENNTPLFARGYFPDDDRLAELYDAAYFYLVSKDYGRYEVSNFARKGRESRHNLKYWSLQPYFGFGAAAHGYDGAATRYVNTDSITEYIASPDAKKIVLSPKDVYNEYVMLRLRTEKGILLDDFRRRFGYSFLRNNLQTINRLASDGYILQTESSISIRPKYMFVMNGIIEEFMLD